MTELPDNLAAGEVARLFPVIAETGKEQKAVSILLSVMAAVPVYAHSILLTLGQRIGNRTQVDTFTEIVFKTESKETSKDRPDGLIKVSTGRGRSWSCLIEAKIGKSELGYDQVDRYIRLAKENCVDAVLTISNQFAANPTHHPLGKSVKRPKTVELYHVSWGFLLTEAIRLHEQTVVEDPEQAFLIRELVRFLSHPSAGVSGFTSMPSEWSATVDKIQAGGRILKGDALVVVGAWHQELRDLSLQLTQLVRYRVETFLARKHLADPELRLSDDADTLISDGVLKANLVVPNAASQIHITADLKTRVLRVSMMIDAPRDKARNSSRLNWFLRQIKNTQREDIYISAIWASRAASTMYSLEEWRDDPKSIDSSANSSEIRAFEIRLVSTNSKRFAGVRTFIDELENLVPTFYEEVGQHLVAWQAPAPKPMSPPNSERYAGGPDSKTPTGDPKPQQENKVFGNAHTELLEIPTFLQRL